METGIANPSTENRIEVFLIRIAKLIGAIGVILGVIVTGYNWASKNVTIYEVLLALNLLTLIVFCLSTNKTPYIELKANDEGTILKDLNIGGEEPISKKQNLQRVIDRSNILVRQLKNNIILWALCLMVVYVSFLLEQIYILKNHINVLNPSKEELSVINLYKLLQNLFNYFSSVFIYLGFKVLYNNTLDKNNQRFLYFMDAIFFSIIFVFIYLVYWGSLSNGVLIKNETTINNIFSLVIGICNGLAMGLLFGRIISMEHYNQNLFSKGSYGKYEKNIFYYGTIFILPLYVLAQPLFGDFDITAFGDKEYFKNAVFLICLIGKLFFLILMYVYTKRKWIHLYTLLVITKHGMPIGLEDQFE